VDGSRHGVRYDVGESTARVAGSGSDGRAGGASGGVERSPRRALIPTRRYHPSRSRYLSLAPWV
jgi:hypothetical protein